MGRSMHLTATSSPVRPAHVLHAFTHPARRPATPADLQALASATRHNVTHAGQTLAAWRWGSGAPVLLLHGWESRASHMAAFVPALLAAGLSAVALDAPAHGDSPGDSSNVVAYGQAVACAAQQLGPLAGVIAHSVGSAAALHAYAHGVNVPASVHLCGPSSLKRVVRGMGRAAGLDAADVVQLEQLMAEQVGVPLSVMDLDQLLPVQPPATLVLHDPQDPEMPYTESLALVQAWPHARLVPIEGVGHRRILREPAVIAQAVGFIQATLQGSAA